MKVTPSMGYSSISSAKVGTIHTKSIRAASTSITNFFILFPPFSCVSQTAVNPLVGFTFVLPTTNFTSTIDYHNYVKQSTKTLKRTLLQIEMSFKLIKLIYLVNLIASLAITISSFVAITNILTLDSGVLIIPSYISSSI